MVSQGTGNATNKKAIDWAKALDDLADLYRDVERRSLSLPMFSLTPFGIVIWNLVKFELCLFLDLLLLIPMNLIIFVRNFFPGRWRYRSFSWPYIRYAITWVWRGEAPTFPIAVIRPLVTLMVTIHANNRLRLVQRRIFLDESLVGEQREHLVSRVGGLLEHWKRPGILNVFYTFILPVTGPAIEGYRYFFPGQLPPFMGFVGVSLLGYALAFVTSAFLVKRALTLGGSGRAAYFPGALAGPQGYGREKQILAAAGIRKTEFPLDIVLIFVGLPVGYLTLDPLFRFYESLGIEMPPEEYMVTQLVVQGAIFLMLITLAAYRRKVALRT